MPLMKSCRRPDQHSGVEGSIWRSKPRAECIRDRVCVGLRGLKNINYKYTFLSVTYCNVSHSSLYFLAQRPCCLENTNCGILLLPSRRQPAEWLADSKEAKSWTL